jgi:hypothetical protein
MNGYLYNNWCTEISAEVWENPWSSERFRMQPLSCKDQKSPGIIQGTKYFLSFGLYWDLNSGPCTCWASALPCEPCPSPFCFSNFSGKIFYFCPGPLLYCGTPTYTSHITGITGVRITLGILVEMASHFLPGMALNHNLPDLLLSSWG